MNIFTFLPLIKILLGSKAQAINKTIVIIINIIIIIKLYYYYFVKFAHTSERLMQNSQVSLYHSDLEIQAAIY